MSEKKKSKGFWSDPKISGGDKVVTLVNIPATTFEEAVKEGLVVEIEVPVFPAQEEKRTP